MIFLTGERLSGQIHKKLREDGLRLAVAFWGTGAAERLTGKGARVICNLRTGGTNPRAITSLLERDLLQPETLRQFDSLHAKVYIGHLQTIVASANLSTNGLGLDGVEQAYWEEAGVETGTTPEIVSWFEDLWERSQGVTLDDLSRAAESYRFRQRVKPSVPSFEMFEVDQDRLPLLRRNGAYDWKQNDEALAKVFGTINDIVVSRLEFGVELLNKQDIPLLTKRRVLNWSPKSRTVAGLYWSDLSDLVIPKAFSFVDSEEQYDTILAEEVSAPEPFDLEEGRFKIALAAALGEARFSFFRTDDCFSDKKHYRRQEAILRIFWQAVRDHYLRAGALKPA